jgi:metal-responsive CopG/Arc/MetJ family transcriptional regulator
VSVSLEKGLLEASDQLAKRLGVSRAKLVAKGLEMLLAQRQPGDSTPVASRSSKRKSG